MVIIATMLLAALKVNFSSHLVQCFLITYVHGQRRIDNIKILAIIMSG